MSRLYTTDTTKLQQMHVFYTELDKLDEVFGIYISMNLHAFLYKLNKAELKG